MLASELVTQLQAILAKEPNAEVEINIQDPDDASWTDEITRVSFYNEISETNGVKATRPLIKIEGWVSTAEEGDDDFGRDPPRAFAARSA